MHPAASPEPPTGPVAPSPDWTAASLPLPPPPTAPPPTAGTARRFIQALVVFLCLFLLVRTVALEPFGVPTGSMAPTLIGNHREADCPRCRYPVKVGEPGPDARPIRFDQCRCPNCGTSIDLSKAREVPGDRLLVDKTAYLPRPPRRWEVAVFHCPADLTKPYVKRVGGLPEELVQIAGGDLYADGMLARKTLAQVREVRLPVFDMNYPPDPGGWNLRWLVEPVEASPRLPAVTKPAAAKPVKDDVLRENALFLDATAAPVGLTYRHWNLDTKAEEPVGDWLAYNGGPAERRNGFARKLAEAQGDPVHDFVLEFDLEVVAGSGRFACRLADGADTVRAEFPIGGDHSLPGVQLAHDGGHPPVAAAGLRFHTGATYHVEFAFVDRRASLAIDGDEVVTPLDLPAEPPGPARRGGVSRPVQVGAAGASVVVRNLRIFRDIHYLGVGRGAAGWRLGPDEYFLLGDNTSNSHDSRLWAIDGSPAPGVPGRDFIGKPFLIHQPMRLSRLPLNGDRVVQTLDWSRLRWLR